MKSIALRIVILLSVMSLLPLAARAQSAGAPSASLKNETDWHGYWQADFFGGPAHFAGGHYKSGVIPFTAPYDAKLRELAKIATAGGSVPGNVQKCIPNGTPALMDGPFELQVSPSRVTIATDKGEMRRIYTDGRAHTADDFLFDSYSGDSIGHWDGDTLVTDTIGLKPTNEIEYGISAPKMHVVERIRLTAADKMEISTTVDDPVALTQPWSYSRTYSRKTGILPEAYCVSAVDRAYNPVTGGQGFNLTPPEGGYIPPGAK
jgi:hypothetical protein